MGPRFFAGHYNIGHWYWEQEHFPNRWHGSFDYYDEIWVPTEFVRKAIAAVSPIPVHTISHPLALDFTKVPPNRARFGLEENAFVFLFTFDFFSTTQRKNPGDVISAFRRAFRADDNAVLVLKSINAQEDRSGRESLGKLAAGAKVIFFDQHLPAAEMNALYASADCYVSLHRSEGLGLGMAQAMALGQPVIATRYGGSLDFMNDENSLMVPFRLVPVVDSAGIYADSIWAEPDVDAATDHLRQLASDEDLYLRLATAAHDTVALTTPTLPK